MLYAAGQPEEKKEEEEEREGEENEKKIKRSDQCRMKSAGKTWRKAMAPSRAVSLTLDDALGECNHGREGLGDREGQLPARALPDHARRLLLTPACVSGNPPHPHQCPLQVCLPPHHVQLSSLGPVAVKGRKVSREFPTSLAPPVLSPAWISLAPTHTHTHTHTHSFVYFLQQRRIPGNRAVTSIATPTAHETQTHLHPHTR